MYNADDAPHAFRLPDLASGSWQFLLATSPQVRANGAPVKILQIPSRTVIVCGFPPGR